ncbi:MAG: bifunctional YncE family protein/alkaline phosphatase family protein [Candidatus Solibacter usitatus]|nr:bifunctional YncE family protein/alkaline phosphatase family protein [Candidatus Solibacter usitatus]
MKKTILGVAVAGVAALLISQTATRTTTGPQPGGGVLLNSGWTIRPAGKQTSVDTFPMSTVVSKDGRHLLVLNGGYNPPSVSCIEIATGAETSRVGIPDGWLGLTISSDGRKVYAGGGSRASVYELDFSAGKLTLGRTFVVVPEEQRTHQDFVGDVQLTPDGRMLYATLMYRDMIVVINPLSGRVIERWKTGRRPYRILHHPDGKSYFTTSWSDASLYHHDGNDGSTLARIRLGSHTTDIVWSARKPALPETEEKKDNEAAPYVARMFVTAGNTNRVYVVGITEGKDLRVVESINLSMTSLQPAGMTPSALALSPDEKTLYVVCSDANAVAVVDISETRSRVVGFVPSGWYPTGARVLSNGRLIVLNGRGGGSLANPRGPRPDKQVAKSHEGIRSDQYVGSIQKGTISWIDQISPEQLEAYTKTVFANSPYRDELLEDARVPDGNPVRNPSPIEHVVYIVKENRTYDQVFGGLEKGNGDKSLLLFEESSAPNHYKLAREFVLFDNFYVNADVSADGHSWTLAAIASDYVQRMWPNSYGARRKHYDYEGQEPAAAPPAGYIWTQVLAAGLSMRNYGYFVNLKKLPVADGVHVEGVRDPQLAAVTNRRFRAFDMDYTDIDRAKVFLEDLAQFEKEGRMPRFLIMRVGNDHTSGTAAGKIAPLAAMADNDAALGMIVEGLSKSRFWSKTAIFVLEDDAQNGADHVDSHRSPAFIISPYTRRAMVDSSFYTTAGMLRTMELILGLRPMTMFDAAAKPMFAAFSSKPDSRPYAAEKPRIALDTRNPSGTSSAARSAKLDFSEADRIDDDELNEILWRAIKGTEPPAPVRSYFGR